MDHLGNWADEPLIAMELMEEGNGTRMKLTHEGLPKEMLDSCRIGWEESVDKLRNLVEAEEYALH